LEYGPEPGTIALALVVAALSVAQETRIPFESASKYSSSSLLRPPPKDVCFASETTMISSLAPNGVDEFRFWDWVDFAAIKSSSISWLEIV
jgi:hypothetical protein